MGPLTGVPAGRAGREGAGGVAAEGRPLALAQIALGLRQMPYGAEQEAERGVGYFFVQHVRSVGDDDAVLARPFGVDMVVADAEAGHDFEFGETRHERGVDSPVPAGRRDRSYIRRDRGDECLM